MDKDLAYSIAQDTILEEGVLDSGANLCVTNPATVSHFKLDTHLWLNPVHIKFGNNSLAISTHYADFGHII